MNPRILVTGASGFTGSCLCRRLLADGHCVRALVRNVPRAAALADEGVDVRNGDIRNVESLAGAFDGIEIVFHLAAVFRQESLPRRTFVETNVTGTENVFKEAAKAGVRRFVHCSTVGVHGEVETIPGDEDAPIRPHDHYQRSKADAERRLQSVAQPQGTELTIVRPTGIYGPGDIRFAKLFRAINRRRFVMIGDGSVFYHLTHVDDVVEGMVRAGQSPAAAGRIYILSGQEPIRIHVLVSMIAELLGVPSPKLRIPLWPVEVAAWGCESLCRLLGMEPPLHRRRLDFFTKNRAFSSVRACEELGYIPRVGLTDGLRQTAAWYRTTGLL